MARLEEHTHMSALTGKPLSGGQIYAPLQHVRTEMCGPSLKVHKDDFEIIGRDDNKYILQVKESLFIYSEPHKVHGICIVNTRESWLIHCQHTGIESQSH